MFDALYIGATGMQAQQAHVDAIANNLANVNTPAFKKNRVSFSELVVTGAAPGAPAGPLAGLASAAGVGVGPAAKAFDAGDLKKTDAPLDVAIVGDGFLELAMPDGSRAFARGGTLKVNADGLLAMQDGTPLKPGILVPGDAQALLRIRILPGGKPASTGLEGKYACPMHPYVVAEREGTCTVCKMPLEKVPGEPAPGGAEAPRTLAVPTEAVLTTGRRSLAAIRSPQLGPT